MHWFLRIHKGTVHTNSSFFFFFFVHAPCFFCPISDNTASAHCFAFENKWINLNNNKLLKKATTIDFCVKISATLVKQLQILTFIGPKSWNRTTGQKYCKHWTRMKLIWSIHWKQSAIRILQAFASKIKLALGFILSSWVFNFLQ